MRRFGLLAALAMARPASGRPLLDLLLGRRGGLDDGTEGAPMAGDGSLALPPGVIVERDVAYGSDPAQRLDVYRPSSAQGAPMILFVHGGGWRRGDKAMAQMVRHKAPYWTGKGFVFLSTNYRMMPVANPIEQAEDVCRALAFAQGKARGWGADSARVVLVGHSAGAHLVALLTADPALAARHGVQPWLATVALDSAALDMVAIMNRRHYRFYDPVFGTDPAFWREASPTHRLQGKPAAPMLMVCSSKRDDSCPPAREFAAKATGFGGRVQVAPIDLGHLELNDQLGARGDYTDTVDAFLRTVGVP